MKWFSKMCLLLLAVPIQPVMAVQKRVSYKGAISYFDSQSGKKFFWNRLRGELEGDTGTACHWQTAYEANVTASEELDQTNFYFSPVNRTGFSFRLADINATPVPRKNGENLEFRQNLDRLNMDCFWEDIQVKVGRQVVTFGTAQAVAPTDLFVPVGVSVLDGEYRRGIDAAVVGYRISATTNLDFGVIGGQDGKSEYGGAFAKGHFLLGETDIVPMIAQFRDQEALGLDVVSPFNSYQLQASWARINVKDHGAVAHWVVGANRQWTEDLFLSLDYYHNEAGAKNRGDYFATAISRPYQELTLFLLARDYWIPTASYQLHPLVSVSLTSYFNSLDQSQLWSPHLEYSLSDNWAAEGGALLTGGDDNSEFGSFANLLFLGVRGYH